MAVYWFFFRVSPETRRQMDELLVKAETMNEEYVPMDTVKFMDEVLRHYMSHGSRDEKIRANYMMGCVHRDRGDSPMALEYYLNAVNLADTTDTAHCDFKKLSRIYGQMATIYRQQRYPQAELEMWKKAESMANHAGDEFMSVHCTDRMGAFIILWESVIKP